MRIINNEDPPREGKGRMSSWKINTYEQFFSRLCNRDVCEKKKNKKLLPSFVKFTSNIHGVVRTSYGYRTNLQLVDYMPACACVWAPKFCTFVCVWVIEKIFSWTCHTFRRQSRSGSPKHAIKWVNVVQLLGSYVPVSNSSRARKFGHLNTKFWRVIVFGRSIIF